MDELDAMVNKAASLMGQLGRLARVHAPATADQLREVADVGAELALELRALADSAKVAERNAAIESTGKQLREIVYAAREDGEAFIVTGYWADGHDWAGKRELIPADGSPSLYLFDDEVLSDEAVE